MRFRITSVDYAPDELYPQTPFEGELVRQIAGNDRSDYWLASLAKPLKWTKEGREVDVNHIVIAARWQGTQIGPGMKALPVGIAYVTDASLMVDTALNLTKCAYVAIGVADEV